MLDKLPRVEAGSAVNTGAFDLGDVENASRSAAVMRNALSRSCKGAVVTSTWATSSATGVER